MTFQSILFPIFVTTIPNEEYEDMLEYMERLRETIDFLSSHKTIQKLEAILERMESGEFLNKDDI
jgi:PHD/YefM family antitoxin component YafN of YafNO toxin-antitoxin module